MAVHGVCPECGLAAPLDAFLADAEARAALVAALRLPEALAGQVVPYLGLFAVGRAKLQHRRLTKLLAELTTMVTCGSVTRGSDTRAAPQAVWVEALAAVLDARAAGTLNLPLKGHGLLAEIAHRRAGRAAQAGAVEAAKNKPLHPSHKAFDGPSKDTDGPAIHDRRAAVAELLGERERLLRLAKLGLDGADPAALEACNERLRALGVDPGAKAQRKAKPQGLTSLTSLLTRITPQEPTDE